MKKSVKHIFIISVLFLLLVGVVNTASADEYNYANATAFLNNISNLEDNSIVTINGSEADVSTDYAINASNITIKSINGIVTFKGNVSNVHFIITGKNVTLQGLSFKNFNMVKEYEYGFGGAVKWTGEDGKLFDCNFTNNTIMSEEGYGGAIYWNGTNGTVRKCNFRDNFVYCKEDSEGGAIYWDGKYGKIVNSNFYNNIADDEYYSGEGGAIYWNEYSDYGVVENCTFINNSVNYLGGAICWIAENGKIVNSNFYNNIAKVTEDDDCEGGAIYWNSKYGILRDCNFTNNTANTGGAVMWAYDDDEDESNYNDVIIRCDFTNNTARYVGGAITFTVNGAIYNCSFKNCIVQLEFIEIDGYGGGAIAIGSFACIINNSIFEKCSSVDNGGAILIFGAPNSAVSGCNFIDCNADTGGAISVRNFEYEEYRYYSDNCTLKDNKFINCSDTYGAAIYNEGRNLTVSGGNGALIYNIGSINNPINVVVLNNGTKYVAKGEDVELTAKSIMGNYTIISPDFQFIIGDKAVIGYLFKDYYFTKYTATEDYGSILLVNGSYAYGNNISYDTAVLIVKHAVQISSGVITVPYGKKINITLNVTSSSEKVPSGTVNVTINGIEGSFTGEVYNGRVNMILPKLNSGVYILNATYLENSLYMSASSNVVLYISNGNGTGGFDLIGYNVYKEFENDTQYHVKVTDNVGSPLEGMIVLVSISNSNWAKNANYTIVTDKDGIATLMINLLPSDYTITAHFADKVAINNISVIATNFNLKADNLVKYFKNGTQYTVKVTDVNNNPVANRTVTITINKASWKNPVKYYAQTNAYGIATLDINLIAGTYSVTSNICYNSTKTTITVLPTLTANNIVKKANKDADLKAKLVDGQGKAAKDKTITFTVKDKVYTTLTNSEGVAILPIHLGIGTWSILIADVETGAQTRATVKVTR